MSDSEKNKIIGGTLYLVSTPIGNLADISERALKVLSEVDFIAAEDTRVTGLLLSHFDISKPLTSYHDHNKEQKGEEIIQKLQAGLSCALVSDAGTPVSATRALSWSAPASTGMCRLPACRAAVRR